MMLLETILNERLNTLINIMLTKGVQPSELADNIFDGEYFEIKLYKENDYVFCELVLSEDMNVLKYTYNLDRTLLNINEINNNVISTLWNRQTRESELINEIVSILKLGTSPAQLESFLKTLPQDLKNQITQELFSVA